MLKRAKQNLLVTLRRADRVIPIRAWLHDGNSAPHPLAGDRAIEWSWVVANLPSVPGRVLDLGCVDSVLSCIASRLGHSVVAVDLRDIEYDMERVTFIQENFNAIDWGDRKFEAILNCSMIEHVGLAGRYGSASESDGDLVAMRKLRECLAPGGVMILTIPVGVDGEFVPMHRIYGPERLPRLLDGYSVVEEQYWRKDEGGRWQLCTRKKALEFAGSERSYALGLFVLRAAAPHIVSRNSR
jgi:SAM-dependent methyltransferase